MWDQAVDGELSGCAFAVGAYLQQWALVAAGLGEGAKGLRVQLDEGVMLVEHGGIPFWRDDAHEADFGGAGVGARCERQPLGNAKMVRVDTKGTAAEGRKVDDGGGDLRADAFEPFEPLADLVGAVLGEEVQRERAVACSDLQEGCFQAGRLQLGKGDHADRALDFGEGRIAEIVPGGVQAVQVAHHLLGFFGFGAGGEQRVDELGERVPRLARRRRAVMGEQQTMDLGQAWVGPVGRFVWEKCCGLHFFDSSWRCGCRFPAGF